MLRHQATGYESRPLLLFYGLSQAGRALSAASPRLGPHAGQDREAWASNGHGLTIVRSARTGDSFWGVKVKVKPTDEDSFSRLSHALCSPVDQGSVEMGAVAEQLFDFVCEFETPTRWRRVFEVWPRENHGDLGNGLLDLPAYDGDADGLQAFLSDYPALRGLQPRLDPAGEIMRGGRGEVTLEIPASRLRPRNDGRTQIVGSVDYQGVQVVVPTLGASSESTHPLMSWWLILFALSMFARYEPKEWARVLDMNSNPQSSRIEFLQDAALIAVPRILADTLASFG